MTCCRVLQVHGSKSLLMYGDDGGHINLLIFTNVKHQLFQVPFDSKQSRKIFFPVSPRRVVTCRAVA